MFGDTLSSCGSYSGCAAPRWRQSKKPEPNCKAFSSDLGCQQRI